MKLYTGLALLLAATLNHEPDVHQLRWLAGCWVSSDKSAQEVWIVDSDDTLRGFSVALGADRIVFYELLSIAKDTDGKFIYTARPSGQETTTFPATEVGKNSAVFTNVEHDYPQEIQYVRDGDRLIATISLLGGDNPNTFEKEICE